MWFHFVEFLDCFTGFLLLNIAIVMIALHFGVHWLQRSVCLQFLYPCKHGYNSAAVKRQCCMRRQPACRALVMDKTPKQTSGALCDDARVKSRGANQTTKPRP